MNFKTILLSTAIALALAGCNKTEAPATTEAEKATTTEAATQTTTTGEAPTSTTATEAANPDWPTYVVATDPSNAPFEGRDNKGLVEGFDVDLINAIAKAEKFNVTIIPQPWSGIFDALNSGERDILIAPLTITAERDKDVDFTQPYIYPTRTAYMLPETATKLGITSYTDLPKATIAAKGGTTNVSSLENDFGADKLQIVPVTSQYLALTSVTSGKTDVGFGDTIVLKYHADQMKDIKFTTVEQTLSEPVRAAFAVKNGNKELADLLSKGITNVVASGEYRKIAVKWFGEEMGNKVADRTEAQMKQQP